MQEKTIVINFDKHEDVVNDMIDQPRSNNWLRVLLDRKMIAGKLWFDRKDNKIEDFKDMEFLKDKTIVISIDIDYFEDIPDGERQSAINEILNFMKNYGLDIKVVTIALSKDHCFNIKPEDIADELCKNINATLVSYQWYVTRFPYLLKYGLSANLSEIAKKDLPSNPANSLLNTRNAI